MVLKNKLAWMNALDRSIPGVLLVELHDPLTACFRYPGDGFFKKLDRQLYQAYIPSLATVTSHQTPKSLLLRVAHGHIRMTLPNLHPMGDPAR